MPNGTGKSVVANQLAYPQGRTPVRAAPIEYSAFPAAAAKPIGEVRVVLSRAATDAGIAEFRRAILLITGATIAGLYIATSLLVRWMVRGPVKRLKETAELAQYLTDQVFESSPDAVAIIGPDYRYQRVNPVYERIWGLPAETFVGKQISDLLGAELFEQILKPKHDRCFAGEGVSYADWLTYAGDRHYVVVTYMPLRPSSERVEAVLVIIRDLTDHMLEILKLNEILRQSNEELERFAYICSHDMQEPVRMMNCYAELLAGDSKAQLDERSSKYLRLITSNAKRMQKMIQDILAFSRVGREEIQIERGDCNDIAREVIAEFDDMIKECGAMVRCGDLPVLDTSETLIRVLFQNLIGNALKFRDGTRTPGVEISADRQEGFWRISVRDNGIGIDPAFSDKVFAIFQRIHRNEDYPGTGIGLSTCRKFIQLCGGEIGFESAIGEGAEGRAIATR